MIRLEIERVVLTVFHTLPIIAATRSSLVLSPAQDISSPLVLISLYENWTHCS
jgi:hypothetical protein